MVIKFWTPRRTRRSRDPFIFAFLWKRDGGVCAICGADTVAWQREIARLLAEQEDRGRLLSASLRAFLAQCGLNNHDIHRKALWDGDHATPLSRGGPDHQSNWRTLCLPCHRKETKRLIYGAKS